MKTVLQCVKKAKGKSASLWLVKVYNANTGNLDIIGLLEKYNDTRYEKHPWKAFKGVGEKVEFIKAFYPNEGGKNAAINAILHS